MRRHAPIKRAQPHATIPCGFVSCQQGRVDVTDSARGRVARPRLSPIFLRALRRLLRIRPSTHPLVIGFAPSKVARAETLGKRARHRVTRSATMRLSPAVTSWRFLAQTDEHWRALELSGAKRQIVLRKCQELTRSVQNAPKKVSSEQNASLRVNSDHGEYRARCGIVRHRRCLNPRMPRSTPSAYSQRGSWESKGTHVRGVAAATLPASLATSLARDLRETPRKRRGGLRHES